MLSLDLQKDHGRLVQSILAAKAGEGGHNERPRLRWVLILEVIPKQQNEFCS